MGRLIRCEDLLSCFAQSTPTPMNRESARPARFSSHYLNGGWETGATVGLSHNPSDLDEPVGEYVRADARQTDTAIEAASAAFREWSQSNVGAARADALDAIGSEILARETNSAGCSRAKTARRCPRRVAEATRAGQIFKFFAAEALRIPRRAVAVGARGHRYRCDARAGRRDRHHRAVEFSARDCRVEDRAPRSPTAIAWCSSRPNRAGLRVRRWPTSSAAPVCPPACSIS